MRRIAFAAVLLLGSCERHAVGSDITLRIAGVGPLEKLLPQLDTSYSVVLKGLVYSLILEPRLDGGWQSQVLEQWVRVDAGRYRFKLDPSATFSDGSPVRDQDLISSLAAWGVRAIESADHWVELEPVEVGTPIDSLLLRAVLFKDGGGDPIGTGPFQVVTQTSERLVLRRVKPLPERIATVELLAYGTRRQAFSAALRGEVDALLMLDQGEIELLDGVPRFQVIRAPGLHAVTVLFNARRLGRAERKTLAEAIPVHNLAQTMEGSCEAEKSESARGSIPIGRPLEVHISEPDASLVRVGLALRRELGPRISKARMSIEPTLLSKQRLADGSFDLSIMRAQAWPEPFAANLWHTRGPLNWGGYSNPAVDRAFEIGDYQRAQEELAEDPPAIFICRLLRTAAIDVRVKNPKLGPYDLLETLPEWEMSP